MGDSTDKKNSQSTLEELKRVEEGLFKTRELMEAKIREEYLRSKRPVILSLFSDDTINSLDFEQKDKYARKVLGRRFAMKLLDAGINFHSLFFHEKSLLYYLGADVYPFINGHGMEGSEEFMKWIQSMWEARISPPGGASIPSKEEKKSPHRYFQIRLRETQCCSCLCGRRVPDVLFTVRSDFTVEELRNMIYYSRSFGLEPLNCKRVLYLMYKGDRLNMKTTLGELGDSPLIEVDTETWEPYVEERRDYFSD